MIDEKGLHVDADKMAKIRDWNRPRNFKDVQRFLGLVQYLVYFLPDITSYTGPLASMTTNGTPFYWKPLHEKCFQMIKAICCRMPILHPIETKKDEPHTCGNRPQGPRILSDAITTDSQTNEMDRLSHEVRLQHQVH